jgi:hypothetical protein
MQPSSESLRIFLDSGVILEGCYSQWGASKGVLILAAQRRRDIRIVLAEVVEREVRRDLALALAHLPPERAALIQGGFEGWLSRVNIEHYPMPSEHEILSHCAQIMPALRHENDVPVVITAMLTRPDWVLSTNTRHWNAELAQRTGLRIATPQHFLVQLHL